MEKEIAVTAKEQKLENLLNRLSTEFASVVRTNLRVDPREFNAYSDTLQYFKDNNKKGFEF